jgi:hypothetical protein
MTLRSKSRKNTILEFYKLVAIVALFCTDLGVDEKFAFKVGIATGLRKLSVWQVGDTGFGFLLAIWL